MLKALVKKQAMEMLSFLYRGGKNGKRRSKAGVVAYGLLMLYAVLVLIFLFYFMMSTLCPPLADAGLGWLYFALAGTMATAFGVIGSVFATQHQLFEAKDNEFLLAMPVPASKILFSRMLLLYLQTFFFEACVLLPAAMVWWQTTASITVAGTVFFTLILCLLPLLGLTLSCLLGWLVALVTSRMRSKSLISVLLSLALLAAYYYLYFQMNHYLQLIVANSQAVGQTMKVALYPLYQMGLACLGSGVALVVFGIIVLLAFGAVYAVLSRSFLRITTTQRGALRVRYEEKALKVRSQKNALLQKELRRFWKSPAYMLNCALGSVILIAGAVVVFFKGDALLSMLGPLSELGSLLPLLACAALCLAASPNVVSAPSISLEGNSLWLIQSLPVPPWQVLCAKLKLHLLVTAPPAVLCAVAFDLALRPDPLSAILLPITPIFYVLLTGASGLFVNLKAPKLDWSSEAAVIKQSLSVILSLAFNWAVIFILGGLFAVCGGWLGGGGYLLLCTVLMAIASALMLAWLKHRGSQSLAIL